MTREEFMNVVYSELSSDSDNCRANRIIDAADEYAEQSVGWIPISEGLPKAYQECLFTVEAFHWENEPVTYRVVQKAYGGERDFIAWMPLPEPYKAESEEV